MSSEEKESHCQQIRNSPSEVQNEKNGNCVDVCSAKSEIVTNNVKEAQGDIETNASSFEMKPPKKELPNLAPISQTSTTNLSVRDERSSLSEEDSSENLESLDWSCSGSRDDGSSYLQPQSQRPKSVSFHTGSSLPIERKISNGKM